MIFREIMRWVTLAGLIYGLLYVSMGVMIIFAGDAVFDKVLGRAEAMPEPAQVQEAVGWYAAGTLAAAILRLISAIPGMGWFRQICIPRSVGPYVVANLFFFAGLIPTIWLQNGEYAAYMGMVAYWGKLTAEFVWWVNRADQ